MRQSIVIATLPFLLLVTAACSGPVPSAGNGDSRPTASSVLLSNADFRITYMTDSPVSRLEWDVELDYAGQDVQGAFAHYDSELTGLGFNRSSYEPEAEEIEATYFRDGIEVELEVELDDGRTQVDLELDDFRATTDLEFFTLEEFGGISIPYYEADLVGIEWEFKFHHETTDQDSVFDYYHAELERQGWIRTKLERDGNEIEADYLKDGVKLELEVELEDGHVEVELELNKLRFYR